MTIEKFIPYGRQLIEESDIAAVVESLKSLVITRGQQVEAFENAINAYTGSRYAVAFSNASIALLAASHVAQISEQDVVVTTPNSFVATVAAPLLNGARPLFIDIDLNSGNISCDQVIAQMKALKFNGRLIFLPVHFAGIAVDIQRIKQAFEDKVVIIEDAAHALGSNYRQGPKVGSCAYSDMTIFSFHPVKTITTGEGGMITTNDIEIARKLRRFKSCGIERDPNYLEEIDQEKAPDPWYYEVQEISSNYNITEMQAALGLSQLKRLNAIAAKRRQLVKLYRQHLKDWPGISLFDPLYDDSTSYHLFVAQIDFQQLKTSRRYVMQRLQEKGIGSQVHYIPLYRHPALKRIYGDLCPQFPQMERYYQQALSLPLYYQLTEEEVGAICQTLKEILYP